MLKVIDVIQIMCRDYIPRTEDLIQINLLDALNYRGLVVSSFYNNNYKQFVQLTYAIIVVSI